MPQSVPVFPVSVQFEDGTIEDFDSVEALETDLEVFDSKTSPGCMVSDALGRRVNLKLVTI
jgi:hypothetical protein